jgi:hypothetical protein
VNEEPPIQMAVTGHTYKCHIPPDELLEMQTAAEPVAPVEV